MDEISNDSFDRALIGAAFDIAAEQGWPRVTVTAAAQRAGLDTALPRARARFPGSLAILLRFGVLADQAALTGVQIQPDASPRDPLFDMLMRRFDLMQMHRPGLVALLRGLPFDPATALALSAATLRSMGWMLDAAGIPRHGLSGALRQQGLLAVWLATTRAWEKDTSPDLSGTMAALDKSLDRAERAAAWLPSRARLHDATKKNNRSSPENQSDGLPSPGRVLDVPDGASEPAVP